MSWRLLFVLYTCGLAALVGYASWRAPDNNWDIVGYVASALSAGGLRGSELHAETFAAIRSAVPDADYEAIVGTGLAKGSYRGTVASDPAALEQQVPFYRSRVLYIELMRAISGWVGGLVAATHAISAVSAGAVVALSGAVMAPRGSRNATFAAAAALGFAVWWASVPALGRLSTPDALYAALGLSMVALYPGRRTAALAVLTLMVLTRSDAILLAALLGLPEVLARRRSAARLALLALAAAVWAALKALYPDYGHLVLFEFTFLPGQRTPYPASLGPVLDAASYLEIVEAHFREYLPTLLGLLSGVAFAVWLWRAGRMATGVPGLILVAVAYSALHFLLFPMAASRHHALPIIIVIAMLAQSAAAPRRRARNA